MEPVDNMYRAANVDGNDDVSQPQYADVMSTRRTKPVRRRPYDDVGQYAAIDHRVMHGQTFLVVVDD